MQHWEERLEAERLALSAPEVVYDYLSKLPKPAYRSPALSDFVVERLLARGEALIDLGLARFATNWMGGKLWDRGEIMRLALMSNRNGVFVPTDRLKDVLSEATRDQMEALMSNPTMDAFVLASIFSNEIDLDEDTWWDACSSGVYNERLRYLLKDKTFHESWSAWEHRKPIEAVWDLYLQAPATERWASALASIDRIPFEIGLPERLKPPKQENGEMSQVEYAKRRRIYQEFLWKAVQEKWVGPGGIEKEDGYSKFRSARRAFAEAYLRRWRGEADRFIDHSDPAFRLAAYGTDVVSERWPIEKFHGRDGDEFLHAIAWNDTLFLLENGEIRAKIKQLVLASQRDLDYLVSGMAHRAKALAEEYPGQYGDTPAE